MNIDIYTDGACSKNPGQGGWAFIILNKDTGDELFKASGSEKLTTNNRMELMAVIQALQHIVCNSSSFHQLQNISIHTDSQYVQQGISSWIFNWKKNNWITANKKPVKNQDLWQHLDKLSCTLTPNWIWVKGHAGNSLNEECDRLAVMACKNQA